MPNENETVKCPWCGAERPITPMPDYPGREAAYCNCSGNNLPFFERPVKPQRKTKESE